MSAGFPKSFGIGPGDVFSTGARDHFVEGAWLLAELDGPVAAVFFATDASFLRLSDSGELFRIDACDVALPLAVPSLLEHDGSRFERRSRLPVTIVGFGGASAPPLAQALFCDYRAFGSQALFVLVGDSMSRAWRGERVDKTGVERWGAGV